MATDLFNNTSNDYIQPDLAPCPDAGGDNYAFEFLSKKEVGVVDGSKTLASLSFSNFSQPITGWSQDKKIIEAGEVIYINGLTKGVTGKAEVFPFYFEVNPSSNYYMEINASIGFYRNFKYSTYNLNASSNLDLSIDVENATNLALLSLGSSVTFDYNDVSIFTFGGPAGYDFSVTNLSVRRSDTSILYSLTKDPIASIPAFKYPNGAMLGYMFKTAFPTTVTVDSDKWLYINHVPSTFTFYEASTGTGYVKYTKTVDVGLNGTSTPTVMSAGDYLNYIDVNHLWEKVGSLRAWIGAEDPATSETNLVTGFYLYNPHAFPIQIDYITII